MISVANQGNVYDLRGLSTDEKPTEKIGNGSTFIEIDTSKIFFFDAESNEWVEFIKQ